MEHSHREYLVYYPYAIGPNRALLPCERRLCRHVYQGLSYIEHGDKGGIVC